MAPDFTVTKSTIDGIAVRAYSKPGAGYSGTTLSDRSKLALSRIADRLDVPYPWTSFTVVETAGGYGMESPSMIWIPSNTASASLTYLVHHEVAHQWFYGMVGNDQQREPFADEAAADLVARTVLGTLRGSRCAKDDLDRRITGYSSSCYYETIYIQGGNKLNSLRTTMGSTRFWDAIEAYLESNRFKLGSTKKLLEALRLASPVDLRPTLEARFPTLY
jgi:aminopeptidase N